MPPEQVDAASRIAATLELWAKVAGALVIVGGFLRAVATPVKGFIVWRREHHTRIVRAVLAPDLAKLERVIEHEDGCANRMEDVLKKLTNLFGDHDRLIEIAMDNRERHDETNDLLTSLGLASDRRHDDYHHRQMMEGLVTELRERRRARRRSMEERYSNPDPPTPESDR